MKNLFLLTFLVCMVAASAQLHAQQFASPAETKKGWGYIRPDSSWLIEPKFTDYWRGNVFQFNSAGELKVMGDYHEGMLRVRMYGDWGYYNSEGKEAIAPQFDLATNFSEGVAAVKLKKKWGFINKKGEWVIQPTFDYAQPFNSGLAGVEVDDLWGYVNHDGRIIIPYTYRTVKKFTEGYAAVEVENNQWTFIDTTGKKLTDVFFSNAYSFKEGMARVIQSNSDGFIDLSGKIVIPCKYEVAESFFEGISRVKSGRWLFIDKQGKPITDKIFINAGDFHDGICRVKTELGWGYINTDGSWAIEASLKYGGAGDFSEAIGRVRLGKNWEFIDKKGKILFPQLGFERAENFNNGYARIVTKDGWGAIDTTGRIVIRPQFKHMYSFKDIGNSTNADAVSEETKEE